MKAPPFEVIQLASQADVKEKVSQVSRVLLLLNKGTFDSKTGVAKLHEFLLFTCSLFNDAFFSDSDYIASNEEVISEL
jgi:hypothetical protein